MDRRRLDDPPVVYEERMPQSTEERRARNTNRRVWDRETQSAPTREEARRQHEEKRKMGQPVGYPISN